LLISSALSGTESARHRRSRLRAEYPSRDATTRRSSPSAPRHSRVQQAFAGDFLAIPKLDHFFFRNQDLTDLFAKSKRIGAGSQ